MTTCAFYINVFFLLKIDIILIKCIEWYGGTTLVDVPSGECGGDSEFAVLEREMQASVRAHRDLAGGTFTRYNVVRVSTTACHL